MKLNMKKIKQQGFTLIELLIAIAFIAGASATVYYIYSKVKATGDANTEGRHLDTLRAGIKKLFASTSSYTGLNNTIVNRARITPDAMRTQGATALTSITNKFGGVVTITPMALGTGVAASNFNAFQIEYQSVPAEVCINLVTNAGAQFDEVAISGAAPIKKFGVNGVDVLTATEQCDVAENVTIQFRSL